MLNSGVEVLEKPEQLNAEVAKDEVVYLLLHSASDAAIVVRTHIANSHCIPLIFI